MKIRNGNSGDPAIIAPEGVISYGELSAYIEMCIGNFRQAGIYAGHRVALYQPTSPRYLISMLALIEMGVIACPISTRLPKSGLDEALRRIDADALFEAERSVPIGNAQTRPIIFNAMQPPFEDEDIDEEEGESEQLAPNRPATIIFTSGSSGTPKAAVHSLANHIESARASNRNISLEPGDRWLLSLPLFHVGGLGVVFRCLQAGAAIVLPGADASLEESLDASSITHISLVSTQLYRLLQNARAAQKLAETKAVLMGGSAMPTSLIERALESDIPIHTSYGMTEMSTQITCAPPGGTPQQLRTSGRPLIDGNIRISDVDEIEVNGPTRFLGYLRDGDLNLPVDDEGWFATGDLGTIDSEGYLLVTGRADNLFISGGENIQPEEIEDCLCQIEGILQAVVVPVDDEEFGQRPVAFIRAEGEWDEDEIRTALRECLPGFKIPKNIRPWPENIPEGMKVDRAKLISYYIDNI